MFKAASIFKITLPQPMLVSALGDAAEAAMFEPCGKSQERSVGWAPPRGLEFGELVENVGGHLIMRLMIETRSVPAQALRDAVDAKVKDLEQARGRKPGKKERRELTEDTRLSMLPMAFSNKSATWVWIDPDAGLLVIDSASQARTDEVVTALVKLMDGITVQHLQTECSAASIMTAWLYDELKLTTDERFNFDIGRACELKSFDESKAVVRYSRHTLDTDEVKNHIKAGKMATKLALTYRDRVEFTLTPGGALAGIKFLDVVFADRAEASDAFDADVAILTGEFKPLLQDLIDALGGEVVEGGAV